MNTKPKLQFFIYRLPIKFTAAVSIIFFLIVVKIFYFDNIPEKFVGAHELGTLFEAIGLSILSSYIFYLALVLYPNCSREYKFTKLIVREFFAIELSFTTMTTFILGSPVSNLAETDPSQFAEKMYQALLQLNPNQTCQRMEWAHTGAKMTWKEMISYFIVKSQNSITDITEKHSLLSIDNSNLITEILELKSHLKSDFDFFIHNPVKNENLTFINEKLISTMNRISIIKKILFKENLKKSPT